MNDILLNLGYNDLDLYKQKITTTLSGYIEKIPLDDGSIYSQYINTDYFLENNCWHLDFFKSIAQFSTIKDTTHLKYFTFAFNNPNVNTEVKFIVYNKIFNNEWKLPLCIFKQQSFLYKLATFINTKYPGLNSIADIDINSAKIKWMDWLDKQDVATTKISTTHIEKLYTVKTTIANFLNNMYESLLDLVDERVEWEKDRWNVKKLDKYGVTYNSSTSSYYIDFNKINNVQIRSQIKSYVQQRLVANDSFSWSSARSYLLYLPQFSNFITELEPTWNDFIALDREHIEKYIEYLHTYIQARNNQKNSHPENYIKTALITVEKFLADIQAREFKIAPQKDVRLLIHPYDKPKLKRKARDQIDYVPDFVLEQLFEHINELPKRYIPLLWIMYKTGLRVSDALMLNHDCLIKLNNSYWLATDVRKVYIEEHRIPIDDELADMIAVLINDSKEQSNLDNNPNSYIFNCYTGKRKGQPYPAKEIQRNLNQLAIKYNIIDETGNIFHFKNHSFRHTYAIKMLNGGTDILTVQELLAHASPEMTLRYAKLLNDTKRKAFDEVHKKGVFSFQKGNELISESNGDVPDDILDMLWQNHKLNAIDTPYGTCLQRTNGKCQFAKQPPCLTCNGGEPCRDLCVGVFEGDIHKYEILINSTKSLITSAKSYNRADMLKENEELLQVYENIYSTIREGNIIYSNLNRLKKGDGNVKL
ncbi:MAG: transposase [Cellulosilyticum sp.]|nr:transposase [Cellulosilyticum sp.]